MLRLIPRDTHTLTAHEAAALHPYTGVTARLLYARGITDAQMADAFLHPSLSQLHDPMRMHGMAEAVDILTQARQSRLPVVVYGDYDVDGICATSLLALALRRFGLAVSTYTPLREAGYGLNCEAVQTLAESHKVLVTVDLGITNHEEVLLAKSLGMQVIVTDHHALPLQHSPADAVMNPLLGDYPFRKLCGTGVAFKLAQALLGIENCTEYLDLAALATVADIVPLQDENRVMVALGLRIIEQRLRPGMRALLRVSGDPAVNEGVLGFRLGPRLNAAGRLDDAAKGVRLMMTDDPSEADHLAEELDNLNTERKGAEQQLVSAAQRAALAHDFTRHRALVVKGENWHVGVIGLAAGRLCNQYACPTCVLSEQEGLLHGSLRSVPGVNIHQCLQACDDLLLRYGGHEQAAGVTLAAENYEAFSDRLQQAVARADESCFIPLQTYDAEVALSECSFDLLKALSQIAPFGCGNPAPLFLAKSLCPEERRAVGADGAHLKVTFRQDKCLMGGIAFGMGQMAQTLPDRVDVVFALEENHFRGQSSLQMAVQAIKPVANAYAESLRRQTPEDQAVALLDSLLDAFACPAGKDDAHEEWLQVADWDTLAQALSHHARGHLLISHSAETAQKALHMAELDVAEKAPIDPRCFATLLSVAYPTIVEGHWQHVWLLDGEICAGEGDIWHSRLAQAQVHILPASNTLAAIVRTLDAGDEAYRRLYRLLRTDAYHSVAQLAQAAGLTPSQTRTGMHAFRQLGLIELSESPFRYTLLSPRKCSLSESPLLGALRHIIEREDAQ